MTPEKPWHQTARWRVRQAETSPFPKPGTKWRPLHRVADRNNQFISIRRFIAGEKKK
jgi:hypothetical protein